MGDKPGQTACTHLNNRFLYELDTFGIFRGEASFVFLAIHHHNSLPKSVAVRRMKPKPMAIWKEDV